MRSREFTPVSSGCRTLLGYGSGTAEALKCPVARSLSRRPISPFSAPRTAHSGHLSESSGTVEAQAAVVVTVVAVTVVGVGNHQAVPPNGWPHACRLVAGVRVGPVPACAGSSSLATVAAYMRMGPSPRARGAVTAGILHDENEGTIPACAGSRRSRPSSRRSRRDHPRVRGEQGAMRPLQGQALGPSPRARGAEASTWSRSSCPRTIPACAGSRSRRRSAAASAGDHPRVRGEQPWPGVPCSWGPGPSPRARGAENPFLPTAVNGGTIPACAGSRGWARARRTRTGDHPRVRGEQLAALTELFEGTGPSPRARGADLRLCRLGEPGGTIPACAGSSFVPFSQVWRARDHPRVRGEQSRG